MIGLVEGRGVVPLSYLVFDWEPCCHFFGLGDGREASGVRAVPTARAVLEGHVEVDSRVGCTGVDPTSRVRLEVDGRGPFRGVRGSIRTRGARLKDGGQVAQCHRHAPSFRRGSPRLPTVSCHGGSADGAGGRDGAG